jgi:hypothetical protein
MNKKYEFYVDLLLLKLIFWFSILSILSVPDEGYSRNVSCALNLISILINTLNKKEKVTKIWINKGLLQVKQDTNAIVCRQGKVQAYRKIKCGHSYLAWNYNVLLGFFTT